MHCYLRLAEMKKQQKQKKALVVHHADEGIRLYQIRAVLVEGFDLACLSQQSEEPLAE